MVTALDHRWENREEDLAVYHTLFDTALALSRSEHPTHPHTGALIFSIINCWEKDRKSVPIEVVSATLTVGENLQHDLNLAAEAQELLNNPEFMESLNRAMTGEGTIVRFDDGGQASG